MISDGRLFRPPVGRVRRRCDYSVPPGILCRPFLGRSSRHQGRAWFAEMGHPSWYRWIGSHRSRQDRRDHSRRLISILLGTKARASGDFESTPRGKPFTMSHADPRDEKSPSRLLVGQSDASFVSRTTTSAALPPFGQWTSSSTDSITIHDQWATRLRRNTDRDV